MYGWSGLGDKRHLAGYMASSGQNWQNTAIIVLTHQCLYEKTVPSKYVCGRTHYDFDKCVAREVPSVYVSLINLAIIDWMFMKNVKKKQMKSYNLDFGVFIFSQDVSIQIVSTTCLRKGLIDGLEYLGYNQLIPL